MANYYQNLLDNHNYVAKPNIVWAGNITTFERNEDKKIFVFFCIDIFTNKIVVSLFRRKPITSIEIVRGLSKAIDKRLIIKPRRELIIHTDRGSQFTSETYKNFAEKYEGFMIPSMSRSSTPKDNSVAERFMRTFKEHKINGVTFQEELFNQIEINSKFQGYRKIFNLYTRHLDLKPNKKSKDKSPERLDFDSGVASMLMSEPKYSKALSERYGDDFRRTEIDNFRQEGVNVIQRLNEIAAKKAELVNKTPFDSYDNNLVIQIVDEQFQRIYGIIQANPEVTRQYVEEALIPIQDMLDNLDDKINILLPKRRKKAEILPLRDPISNDLFNIFVCAAGSQAKYKQDLRCAQLKIAYTILHRT